MKSWSRDVELPEGDRSAGITGKGDVMIEDGRSATGMSDPWVHRSKHMQCYTCMYYVTKQADETVQPEVILGRCRRHAPTMGGYPAVFVTDWCGDHKVDENKL